MRYLLLIALAIGISGCAVKEPTYMAKDTGKQLTLQEAYEGYIKDSEYFQSRNEFGNAKQMLRNAQTVTRQQYRKCIKDSTVADKQTAMRICHTIQSETIWYLTELEGVNHRMEYNYVKQVQRDSYSTGFDRR